MPKIGKIVAHSKITRVNGKGGAIYNAGEGGSATLKCTPDCPGLVRSTCNTRNIKN